MTEKKFGFLNQITKVNIALSPLVRSTSIDTTLFWFSLYVTPIFWLVFFIIYLFGLDWMWATACLIGLILSGSNTIGYYKCSGEQKKKINNYIIDKGTEQLTNLFNKYAPKV